MFVGPLRKSVGSPTASEATPRKKKSVILRITKMLENLIRRINVFLLSRSQCHTAFSKPRVISKVVDFIAASQRIIYIED